MTKQQAIVRIGEMIEDMPEAVDNLESLKKYSRDMIMLTVMADCLTNTVDDRTWNLTWKQIGGMVE